MKATDNHWSRVIIYHPLMAPVDVVWILHSTWSITPDRLKYILSMAFRLALAVGRGGRGLEKDT